MAGNAHPIVKSIMKTIIPVASGKGGVGKSFLTANLGIAMAQRGKTVVLIDLDLGGSNLHTLLGIRNRNPGIGHFVHGHSSSLEELIVPTRQDHLFFIPGDALYSGTANLPYYRKVALLKQINALPADFIFLDLGSGSAYNTIDFFISSSAGLLVTVPETTAILNAYSFLKASMLRLLQRTFSAKSRERATLKAFVRKRLEGAELTLNDAILELDRINAQSGRTARERLSLLRPRIVFNMGRSNTDLKLGTHLRSVVKKNLTGDVQFFAYLPHDEIARRAAIERVPTMIAHPDTAYARAVLNMSFKLLQEPTPRMVSLYPGNEDLIGLARKTTRTDHSPP